MAPPDKSTAAPAPAAEATKPKHPNRFAGLSRKQVRREIDSRALEMLIASIHGLRTDVDAVVRRLTEDEREPPLLTRVSALEAELRLLRDYLDRTGLRPPERVQPPEFVAGAPTIVVEAKTATAGALPASASLADRPPSVPAVVVTAARWGLRDDVGQTLSMHATVDGASDGTEVVFRIFERGEQEPFGLEVGAVKESRVEAVWHYGKVGLALDFLQWPTFHFVVEVLGARAESNLLPGGAVLPWNELSEP